MQNTMFHKRRRWRRRRAEILENRKASVEKHDLSHADTQLRLARTHERNEADFPFWGTSKEDAQTPNLRPSIITDNR